MSFCHDTALRQEKEGKVFLMSLSFWDYFFPILHHFHYSTKLPLLGHLFFKVSDPYNDTQDAFHPQNPRNQP